MFCIFLLQIGNPLELSFNDLLFFESSNEVVLEIIIHYHFHIVRGEGSYTKLYLMHVISDVLGQRICVSLFFGRDLSVSKLYLRLLMLYVLFKISKRIFNVLIHIEDDVLSDNRCNAYLE